ncbi:MAG: hypothetical protein IH599_00860 [Bacteroidales bacterium]|nr:hypothetical protein [Bacteroidales bacterium]
MLRLYAALTDKDVSDPMLLQSDPEWLEFRLYWLTRAVEGVRDRIRGHGLISTAAVFPTPRMARHMVRQDWTHWGLDVYFPMAYHNFYNEPIGWIEAVMRENRKTMLPGTRIICGLYLPALQQGNDFTEAMEAAYRGGADGIAFFSLDALSAELLQQLHAFSLLKKANHTP